MPLNISFTSRASIKFCLLCERLPDRQPASNHFSRKWL